VDFGFSPEQEQLARTVRDYLAVKAPISFAREMADSDTGLTNEVWTEIASMGWLGLTVPEDFGGIGLGWLDLAIVMEAMGEVVFPGPFMSTTCLAIPTLLEAADTEQKATLLPAIVAGTERCTVAIAEESAGWRAASLSARATATTSGYELSCRKLFVPDAVGADSVLIAARLGDGLGLFRVESKTAGVTIGRMETVDRTRRLATVTCESVALAPSSLLGGSTLVDERFDALVDLASTMLASEMCGAAARALEMTVEYLQLREQFGRAIATFQALQHRAADMKVCVENVRSLAYYGAWSFDDACQDARLPAAMLKAYASDACMKVVCDAIQLHGGIGFTWEHDLQLYFKRLKSDELTFGDATETRERVAKLLEI
jgi:alkylation response protein AidB-like acyl-CoA dehydrogenase